MTEKEKKNRGKVFDTKDSELLKDMAMAQKILVEYNQTLDIETNVKEVREKLLKKLFAEIGENAEIRPPFLCDYGYHIKIGKNFFMNFGCVFLDAGEITIGDNCLIGPKTGIYAVGHPKDLESRRKDVVICDDIHIGNDVWIGGGVTILQGVSIGNNVIVGAGSVVTKSIPDNVIVAGNPARIISKAET